MHHMAPSVTNLDERKVSRTTIRVPDALWPALRSDHAGETCAVYIYPRVLSVTRDDEVICFARHHLAT